MTGPSIIYAIIVSILTMWSIRDAYVAQHGRSVVGWFWGVIVLLIIYVVSAWAFWTGWLIWRLI